MLHWLRITLVIAQVQNLVFNLSRFLSPDENEDSEQPPLNPSEPSEGAVRVAPKKSGIKRQMVLLNPQK